MVGEGTMVNEVECNYSFFEEMDDLVDDFPAANYDTTGIFSGASSDDLSAIWSNPLPYEDIAQLEWLSTFVEDSFSGEGLTITKENTTSLNKESSSSSEESQNSSPVSNTESCFSDEKSSKKGFRTKRARPATFNPPSFPNPSEYQNNKKVLKLKVISSSENNKEKKTKPNVVVPQQGENVRKCTHCEITQTPQWRAGPLGPKTLCNACGVRHKTGRLFPEYRPAASPTFVASLHSNSHKKVLEMRNKCDF